MSSTQTENRNQQRGSGEQRGGSGQSQGETVDLKHVTDAALTSFREYARSQPETVALWCIGIGFILGWKLKPW